MPRLSSLLAALTAAACFLRVSKAGLDLPISLLLHGGLAASLVVEAVQARLWARGPELWAAFSSRRVDLAVPVSAAVLLLLRHQPTDLVSATLIGLGLTRATLTMALRGTTWLLAAHALHFQLTRPDTAVTALQRFQGWTGDPNDVALVALLAAFPAALALSEGHAGSRRTLLNLVHVLIAGVIIILTQSRLALVAFVLVTAWAAAPLVRTRPRIGVALVAVLVGLVALAPDRFWFRFFRLLEGNDLGMRPYLWEVGLTAFRESPWTGVGVGRFPELARGLAPHSLLLECLAEGGLLHTTALAALAASLMRSAYASRAQLWGAAALALALAAPLDGRVLAIVVVAPLFIRCEAGDPKAPER